MDRYDVAVFAALGWEARAVKQALSGVEPAGRDRTWSGYLGDGASCLVVCTGVGPVRAAAAVGQAPPARLYLSAGCAGGAVDSLRTGDLVAATRVIALGADGGPGETAAVAGAGLATWLAGRGLPARAGAIASSASVLGTPLAKAAAARAGALVVDMESAAIASAARRRGGAFLGLRVVLDEVGHALPLAAIMVDETGETPLARSLAAAAVRPRLWPALVRLGRQRRVADRRLRAALAVLFGGGLDALGVAPASRQASGG